MTHFPVPVTVFLKLDISLLECEKMLCHFFSTLAGVLLGPTTSVLAHPHAQFSP